MRLVCDENIPKELVDILAAQGFDVLRVPSGTDDKKIGLLAIREERLILSQDKDFANPWLFPPHKFHGIIRIKIHPPVLEDIGSALEKLFRSYPPKTLKRKLVILERDGFRMA